MAAKIAIVCIALFVLMQFISASPRVAREVDTPDDTKKAADTSKVIDDALGSLKTGFEDVLRNIQSNDFVKNFTASIQKLGDEVAAHSEKVVADIKKSAAQTA